VKIKAMEGAKSKNFKRNLGFQRCFEIAKGLPAVFEMAKSF